MPVSPRISRSPRSNGGRSGFTRGTTPNGGNIATGSGREFVNRSPRGSSGSGQGRSIATPWMLRRMCWSARMIWLRSPEAAKESRGRYGSRASADRSEHYWSVRFGAFVPGGERLARTVSCSNCGSPPMDSYRGWSGPSPERWLRSVEVRGPRPGSKNSCRCAIAGSDR
jgi:hypothetical protein